MKTGAQRRKARILRDLHSGHAVLVLPNVWDPIGARVLASKGYPAVATASAAVSSSLGFDDGEKIARRTMLEILRRLEDGSWKFARGITNMESPRTRAAEDHPGNRKAMYTPELLQPS